MKLTDTLAKITSHMLGIPISDFPSSFRDAILTVRNMGLKFLWIDALCIV